MSEPSSITIPDTGNKLSFKGGVLTFSYEKQLPSTSWHYEPLEQRYSLLQLWLLNIPIIREYMRPIWMITSGSGYLANAITDADIEGAFDSIRIETKRPTVWQFTFTPPNGEPRHLAIEHDELTPAKLAEVCK